MRENEITFERNISGSYMKILEKDISRLDDRLLLGKKLPGLLAMEKNYLDEQGVYYYNITGMQSLAHFCQMKPLNMETLKRIVMSIYSQIDILNHHLIHPNCLILKEDCIFVSNNTNEIIFCAYPKVEEDITEGFRRLVEFLLTRIDHGDAQAIKMGYAIYEKTLVDGFSLEELEGFFQMEAVQSQEEKRLQKEEFFFQERKREANENGNYREIEEEMPDSESYLEKGEVMPYAVEAKPYRGDVGGKKENKAIKLLASLGKRIRQGIAKKKRERKNYKSYGETLAFWQLDREESGPEDARYVRERKNEGDRDRKQPVEHPTICLSDYREHPEGLLLYEGYEELSNYRLQKEVTRIGQNEDADLYIPKDTISRFQACISREGEDYYLEDLNSTNGTFVNDQMLAYQERHLLKSNDIVRFADVKYRFI